MGLFWGRHYLEWTWWLVRALDTTSSRHGEPWLPLIGSNSFRFTTYIIIIFIIILIDFTSKIDIIMFPGPWLTLVCLDMLSFKRIELWRIYCIFLFIILRGFEEPWCAKVLISYLNSTSYQIQFNIISSKKQELNNNIFAILLSYLNGTSHKSKFDITSYKKQEKKQTKFICLILLIKSHFLLNLMRQIVFLYNYHIWSQPFWQLRLICWVAQSQKYMER